MNEKGVHYWFKSWRIYDGSYIAKVTITRLHLNPPTYVYMDMVMDGPFDSAEVAEAMLSVALLERGVPVNLREVDDYTICRDNICEPYEPTMVAT